MLDVLKWGRQVPTEVAETAGAVWGARLIAPADLLFDRQDMKGDADGRGVLRDWLNSGPLKAALAESRHLFDTGRWSGASQDERVLYEDERGKIVGSPQGSFGYVYVAAWIKP